MPGRISRPGTFSPVSGQGFFLKGATMQKEKLPHSQQVLMLAVDEVFPDPYQPRQMFDKDSLDRIVASIAARGILQPIRVRWDDQRGCWVIISGEFRWRGTKLAGLTHLPCLPVDGELSESDLLADQIIENTVRNSLKPTELARAVAKLKALKGCNSQALAKELGISGGAITKAEALLSLPEEIQAMVDDGRLAESVGYEISRLPTAESQREVAQEVAATRLPRDAVSELVRGRVGKRNVAPKASRITCKLDGGISFTLSAGQPLTWDDFNFAMDRVRKEAKKLYEGGKAVTDLSRLLRVS
jgi:ParB family chromosome partitioning protein